MHRIIKNMAQVEYITIKNASRKVLNKMREIGEKKAQRLQENQGNHGIAMILVILSFILGPFSE